jgi:hypothetical protein
MNTQDMFFNFKRTVERIQGDTNSVMKAYNGIAFSEIERYFTDENNVLNLIVKSQTEGQRMGAVTEKIKGKNVMVEKPIKATVNVIIAVEGVEQIKKFLDRVDPGNDWVPVEPLIKPELTGMD